LSSGNVAPAYEYCGLLVPAAFVPIRPVQDRSQNCPPSPTSFACPPDCPVPTALFFVSHPRLFAPPHLLVNSLVFSLLSVLFIWSDIVNCLPHLLNRVLLESLFLARQFEPPPLDLFCCLFLCRGFHVFITVLINGHLSCHFYFFVWRVQTVFPPELILRRPPLIGNPLIFSFGPVVHSLVRLALFPNSLGPGSFPLSECPCPPPVSCFCVTTGGLLPGVCSCFFYPKQIVLSELLILSPLPPDCPSSFFGFGDFFFCRPFFSLVACTTLYPVWAVRVRGCFSMLLGPPRVPPIHLFFSAPASERGGTLHFL